MTEAPARVAVEEKHHYAVLGSEGLVTAQVTGRLLHEFRSHGELPKVGDWVAIAEQPDEKKASIRCILPRRTKLSRKVPGRVTKEQDLVMNIDRALVVQAFDCTFNLRLLERYLLTVHEGALNQSSSSTRPTSVRMLKKRSPRRRSIRELPEAPARAEIPLRGGSTP